MITQLHILLMRRSRSPFPTPSLYPLIIGHTSHCRRIANTSWRSVRTGKESSIPFPPQCPGCLTEMVCSCTEQLSPGRDYELTSVIFRLFKARKPADGQTSDPAYVGEISITRTYYFQMHSNTHVLYGGFRKVHSF